MSSEYVLSITIVFKNSFVYVDQLTNLLYAVYNDVVSHKIQAHKGGESMADKDVLQKKSDVNYGEIAVIIIALLVFAYAGSGKFSIKTENFNITCEKNKAAD